MNELCSVRCEPGKSPYDTLVHFGVVSSGDPLYDFANGIRSYDKMFKGDDMKQKIKKIIFDPPYTILIVNRYGKEEKVIVKAREGEDFDELTGFVMAFAKMNFGESYKAEIRKLIFEKAYRSNRNHKKEIKEKKLEVISLDWKEKLVEIVKAAIESGKDGKEDHEDTI